MQKMQEQIDRLISNTNMAIPVSNQQSPLALLPSQNTHVETETRESTGNIFAPPSPSRSRRPEFMGPTSSTYLLGVAANSLERAGIHTETSTVPDRGNSEDADVPIIQEAAQGIHRQVNPLLKITQDEALRLIDLYEEESGSVYPFLEKALICKAAHAVYERPVVRPSSSLHWAPNEENKLSDGVGDILKLVIAIALVIEGQSPCKLSSELLESVESGFHSRVCGATVDVIEIQAWTAMVSLQWSYLDTCCSKYTRAFFNFTATKRFSLGGRLGLLVALRSNWDCIAARSTQQNFVTTTSAFGQIGCFGAYMFSIGNGVSAQGDHLPSQITI